MKLYLKQNAQFLYNYSYSIPSIPSIITLPLISSNSLSISFLSPSYLLNTKLLKKPRLFFLSQTLSPNNHHSSVFSPVFKNFHFSSVQWSAASLNLLFLTRTLLSLYSFSFLFIFHIVFLFIRRSNKQPVVLFCSLFPTPTLEHDRSIYHLYNYWTCPLFQRILWNCWKSYQRLDPECPPESAPRQERAFRRFLCSSMDFFQRSWRFLRCRLSAHSSIDLRWWPPPESEERMLLHLLLIP